MTIDSINQSTYKDSSVVHSYDSTVLQAAEVSILVEYKEAYFGRKILDIGCGTGRTSFYFRNFTKSYTGVDYSEEMVKSCLSKLPELDFRCCDARDLSQFEDNEFDFVMFSYNGIDYIDDDGRRKVLDEIRRVLKDGGTFAFSTHNRNYFNILTQLKFKLFLNPKKIVNEVLSYFEGRENRKKLRKNVEVTDQYAILNDVGNNFGLLTYYIDKQNQIEQLKKAGFELEKMFDYEGKLLGVDDDDSKTSWIYFVVN